MPNHFYTNFKEVKFSAPSQAKKTEPVGAKQMWNGQESTANWPSAGKPWKSSFNRATKMPVVKQYAKKQGID